ncbi:hypothetical protein ColTof4_06542 [Colletotrichum tofieldiae]|nr:hypothetical protein ColTof3_11505 [Colletotrichum tofieldiae]GKT74119.1 hypothetical protein ColTof4_06542 [Colletotrichum tofieldiae]
MSGNRSDFARDEDESSYKREPYDDFILFPDESQTDTYEDVSAYTEQPAAPLAPRIHRLRTPDIAPLSTDVQFFPCLGDEAEEDRINEAWYLAGRERVRSQIQCSALDPAMSFVVFLPRAARLLTLAQWTKL